MKKLMTIMATAASLFAFGATDGLDAGIGASFEAEGYVAGEPFDSTKADDGVGTTEGRYWYHDATSTTDSLIISNYVNDGGTPISGTAVPTLPLVPGEVDKYVQRPDMFNGEDNSKYLAIDTTAPIVRRITQIGTDDSTPDEFVGTEIPENGIYLDTLVKFTAAEQPFEAKDFADGDKIAIEYVEGSDDWDGVTNFVIRAGYLSGAQVIHTNYFAVVPEGFVKDDWHRLTVRTLPGIDSANHVGFVVYLDQTALTYDLVYDENMAPGDDEVEFVGAAANFKNKHQLYPSAIISGGDKNKICAASFSGCGCIDDVVFTTTTPEFITAGESIPATITLGTGIASVTVTVGDKIFPPVDASASPLVFMLDPGTESFNLGVTPVAAEGYTFAGIDGATYDNGVVTWDGAAPTFTVLATRNGVSYIDENDITVECAKLSEAFANAKDGSTITLAYDVDSIETEGTLFAGYEIGEDTTYVLDLAGHTIYGGDDGAGASLITVKGTLTIIDSVGGGGIVYDTEYYGIVSLDGSDANIGAATGDMGAKFTGYLFEDGYEGTIVRGYFDVASNTVEDPDTAEEAFAFAGCIDTSVSECAADPVAGYWFVAPSGEEPPATHAISWTITGGTTESAEGDFVEGSTIVFTADEGKTLSFVSIDGVEIDDTSVYGASSYTYTVGAADAELVVEFTEPIIGTYEVTVTPNENATYEAAYSVGGAAIEPVNDVLTVTVGQAVTITATPADGYEYATVPDDWSAGQDGAITIEVSAAGTVEIPAPTLKQVIGTYEVTVTPNENATYEAAYSVGGAAIEPVNDVLTVTVGQAVTITATPADGYEYASAPEGWTLTEGVITIEVSAAGTVAIPAPTAVTPPASDYKVEIEGVDVPITFSSEEIAQFAAYGLDTPEAVNAFLAYDFGTTGAKVWEVLFLGLDPTDADALDAFKFATITMADGKVVLTMPDGITLQTGHGVDILLKVYGSSNLTTWSEEPLVTATNTTEIPEITPALGETKKFYKVVVDFAATPAAQAAPEPEP